MEIEFKILDWIQSIHTPAGDVVMKLMSGLGNAGAIWILLALILLFIPKTRKSGMILILALCIDVVLCNVILKNLIGRIRPCDVNNAVNLLIARPDDYSFPSGHTAAAFATVAALFFAGEKRLWKVMLVPAVCIAFSRMYLYVHYPTDILGGIVVGVISGYIGCRLMKRIQRLIVKNKQTEGK